MRRPHDPRAPARGAPRALGRGRPVGGLSARVLLLAAPRRELLRPRTPPAAFRAGRRRRRARRPAQRQRAATTDPAMMRSPGSSAAPWVAKNLLTKATVSSRGLGDGPPRHLFAGSVTTATMAHGSAPGTSSPKITPRWQTLPARTGSMSSKDTSRSTSSRAGASPATPPSSPTRTATSTSTAGARQRRSG